MIFSRTLHKTSRIGCCGKVRLDTIFPLVNQPSFEDFKQEAKQIVKKYNLPKYNGGGDVYSLEYYEGAPGQEDRGRGKSLYKCQLNSNGNWEFFVEGRKVNVEDL